MPCVGNGYAPQARSLDRSSQPDADEAVAYIAQDSRLAAEGLLMGALDANIRELLVRRYRLLYEVTPDEVQILAFVRGARDLTRWRL